MRSLVPGYVTNDTICPTNIPKGNSRFMKELYARRLFIARLRNFYGLAHIAMV